MKQLQGKSLIFVETRKCLENATVSVNELRNASTQNILRVETLNDLEIILFRKIVVLYFEELQTKIRTISKERLKSNPYKDYFKDRDEKNISYTDVLLFLFGKKQYEIIREDFLNGDFISKTEEFLQTITIKLNPSQ